MIETARKVASTDKDLGVYILRLQRLAVEARRVAERLACLHEFDPECARCEWMTPFRKALGESERLPVHDQRCASCRVEASKDGAA